jgi:hypothetical protein
MSGVDRFNQRADLALAKQGVLTDKELLSIDDLRDAWNAQSDAFNSWDELGIDEIIWFAQQQAIARYAPLAQPKPVAPTVMQIIAMADEIEEEELGQVDLVRRALTRWGRPAVQPVAVAEGLPEAGQKVIAYYLNALGNRRTILAEWVPAKSRTDDCLVQDDSTEYDEETDEYYWPEGWYESIENWDDYGAVFVNEGVITHWQPLPAGPALPTQPPITP